MNGYVYMDDGGDDDDDDDDDDNVDVDMLTSSC